jgi:hypothetical protein
MPLPAALVAAGKAIGAFAAKNPQLINAAVNTGSTLLTNQLNKSNQLQFYDRQRIDALGDWNRQNIYNNPKEQMARYKEAGLNPHLIYGQTNVSQPIRSVDMKAPTADAPKFELTFASQQLANMNKQGQLIDQQILNQRINNEILKDSQYYKVEQERQKSLLTGSQYQNQLFNRYKNEEMLKPQLKNLLSNYDLSQQRQSEIAQKIQNLKTTNQLLGQQYLTEKQKNDFVQQVDAVSKIGGLGIKLLSLLFK